MEFGLKGRHIAILAADGIDGAQVVAVRRALAGAGAVADVLGLRSGNLRVEGPDSLVVERALDQCHSTDFDALVIPGGKAGIEALRAEPQAVQFVKEFMAADKPAAVIGEGVAMLVAAEAAAGRVVAGGPVADEVRRAGGDVVDAAVHVDEKLITGRDGRALDELNAAILREFANRVDEARVDQLSEQSFPASDPPPGPVAVGGEGASKAQHLDPQAGRRELGEPEARP
jgi:protease I